MKYEINIAKRNGSRFYDGKQNPAYSHFAKVTLPQSTYEDEAQTIARQFADAFPSPDYKLTLTRWQSSGREVEFQPDIAAELSAMADTLKTMEPDAGHPANRT